MEKIKIIFGIDLIDLIYLFLSNKLICSNKYK
jgi:hypothetical protein